MNNKDEELQCSSPEPKVGGSRLHLSAMKNRAGRIIAFGNLERSTGIWERFQESLATEPQPKRPLVIMFLP